MSKFIIFENLQIQTDKFAELKRWRWIKFFVCQFECPIITHEPLGRFASKGFVLSGFTFTGKK